MQKVQKGRDDERQSWTAPRSALKGGQRVQMVQKVQASEKYRLTQTRARFTPQRTNYGLIPVEGEGRQPLSKDPRAETRVVARSGCGVYSLNNPMDNNLDEGGYRVERAVPFIFALLRPAGYW